MSATKGNADRQNFPRRLRRVVIEEPTPTEQESLIEERQRRTLDHARMAAGYAEDVDPHAYDRPPSDSSTSGRLSTLFPGLTTSSLRWTSGSTGTR